MQPDAAALLRLNTGLSPPRHAKRNSVDDADLLGSGDDRSDNDDDGQDVDRNGKRKRPISVS